MLDDKFMEDLNAFARDCSVPIVRDATAKVLCEIVSKIKPAKILEIGTAIGYSTLLIKKASPTSQIVTIEKDEDRYNQAKVNIANAKVDDIECILGDAFDVLDKLIEKNVKFDFVFLDGPKGYYFRYLQKIKLLLNDKALIFADNVGFFGMVKSGKYPHRHKTIVVSLQNYLKEVSDKPFESTIELDIDDGYCISKYDKENI